ncbi:MAG: flippase activity-associated protein Agl23 [Haloarculaceae archaeon]
MDAPDRVPGDRLAGDSRLFLAVAAVTALALLARFVLLGDRVAHWDEARVGYWILDFARTGTYYYRPIVHGPFFQQVNRLVFGLIGASDFSMRVAAALVGGLLPLSALLFRARLRDSEVVALSLFLAANPILLYFSRFMRGDVVVGGFMFVGFALLVRGIDTRRPWYLLPSFVAIALAFTAKENAFAYLAAWVGASVLLLDHRLIRARDQEGTSWGDVATGEIRRVGRAVRSALPQLLVSLVAFVLVIVVFYAPRGDVPSNGTFYRFCSSTPRVVDMGNVVGFGQLLAHPGAIPDVVIVSTAGSFEVFACQWIGGSGNPYLPFLGDLALTVGYGAGALALLGIIGFVADRYGDAAPRDLVMFAFYWGVASLFGYPIITDIKAPWAAVHVVLPLAIPAAVGAALIYRWGTEALAEDDRVSVALAFGLLLLVAGQVAGAAVYTSYVAPQSRSNELVQYAQPEGRLHPTLDRMADLAAKNDQGPDVLLYGDYFVDGDTEATRAPACAKWFNSLPLPWYWQKGKIDVACATSGDDLNQRLAANPPPVVIVPTTNRSEVARRLGDDYEAHEYLLRSFDTNTVFFLRKG